jgi:hypothetical protein
VRNCPQVFRQARPPECEARAEVCRRNIELPVFAEEPHYFVAIHAQRFTDVADLVRKADFDAVKAIAGVFHHLGHPYGGDMEGRVDTGVQRS